MIRLRTALLCDKLYVMVFLFILLLSLIRINLNLPSKYTDSTTRTEATIQNQYIDGNKLELTLRGKEKFLATYYFKKEEELKEYKETFFLGDKVEITGVFSKIDPPGTKNIFNYKKYLERKKIYYQVSIANIKKISSNKNIYYLIKQKIINRLNNNPYLYTFILGDKSYLTTTIISTYQNNGISHLFAISGMHINLLGNILLKILKKLKIKEEKSYFITSIVLILYLLLTGLSASILRGVLFFLLFAINKIYYLYIKNTNIFLITLDLALLLNPFYIYDVACWYSFTISLTLLMMGEFINNYKHYLMKLFTTSTLSFITSIPITLFNFYQLNILSIIYNLFYVPFISVVIFPLSLMTYIIPILEPIYNFFTSVLEYSSILLDKVNTLKFIFPKENIRLYFIYYILIIIFLKGIKIKKKSYIVPLLVLLLGHYLFPLIDNRNYIKMIDVGQGDSFLLHSNNETAIIDTGGKMTFKKETWQQTKDISSIVKTTTIPLLKSLGIKKVDYLLLTHGDADHAKEAITLLENFQIEKVYINEGGINNLEKQIIKQAKDISIAKENTTFQVGRFNFLQINTDLGDENDSSSIYYVTYADLKMLFMADASVKSEQSIMDKYELEEIDILKIGHHGSITSSGEEFLRKINPKIALISAGKDNKFNHPRKEIIERLNRLSINYYLTINTGTVTINLNNYKITTDKKS